MHITVWLRLFLGSPHHIAFSHWQETKTIYYLVGCRQKMKKILPPLFRSGSTQRSIWRPFFDRPIPFSLATRAFYAAPLAAPSWTPLFRLFWLPCQKYYLEMEFLADFHICWTELPPFPEMRPDLKLSASKKSYGLRKIRHFSPF